MLRSHSCLQASRQPTDLVQDGWLSHIRTPRLSPAWERTRGIHADGRCPSAYVRRHGPVGLVHGWNARCRYGVPERSLPFTPYSLHTPETCSTAFLTAYRQSHHNDYGTLRKHAENRSGRRLEGVFQRHIPSLSENRRERHSRQPLERHRPKRPQPYCQKG